MRKLQCFEVVKIFDHILFLAVSQFDNISRRKLIQIVSYQLPLTSTNAKVQYIIVKTNRYEFHCEKQQS